MPPSELTSHGGPMKPNPHRKQSQPPKISRRRLLRSLGSAALAASLSPALRRTAQAAAPRTPASATAPSGAVTLRAIPFDLTQVRLLDGPFLEAQKRDAKYLLQLEPDRLLCNFRINAGLEPKAPVYGGWESVQTWADIRAHGHTL